MNVGHAKISSYPEVTAKPVGWFYTTTARIMDNKGSKRRDIHQFSQFVFSKIEVDLVIDDTFFNCCQLGSTCEALIIDYKLCYPGGVIHSRTPLFLLVTRLRKE